MSIAICGFKLLITRRKVLNLRCSPYHITYHFANHKRLNVSLHDKEAVPVGRYVAISITLTDEIMTYDIFVRSNQSVPELYPFFKFLYNSRFLLSVTLPPR